MKTKNLFAGYLFILLITAFAGNSYSQYDSIAIAILDSISDKIDPLETCSFRFESEFDISNSEYGLITHSESGTVYLKGPDKLFIEKKGDRGHKQFYYNGKTFLLYSFDKNQYASMAATMSLMELIDSVSSYYGVDFPGSDIFYPDFVDNILASSNNLVFLGLALIDDTECYHVAGATDDKTFQFWINTQSPGLPLKMSIDYITKTERPRYSIRFSDWKLDEDVSDSKFEFSIPAGAQLIKLLNKQ